MSNLKISDYLDKTVHCECGRVHEVELETVEISKNALERVPEILNGNYKKPFIIADRNTYEAAGKRLVEIISSKGISCSKYVFAEGEVVPDEDALGRLFVNYDPTCDLIIGVGTGTLNDMARFFSHRLGLPYYIVATAPSMDGYASTGAALIRNKLKTTFECQMPKAIIADLDIVGNAPKEMIAAGFCDVIGKYTCLADWELSNIINDEYYCDYVAQLTRQSLERTIANKEAIQQGENAAIAELMEALVLAGIAMAYVGNSRPASGSEHHLSHFWEMRFLLEGKKAVLHGTKVGIGAVLVARLHQLLKKEALDKESILSKSKPDTNNWAEEINRVFLAAAPEVILLEEETQKNSLEAWEQRIQVIADNWEDIYRVLTTIPSAPEIIEIIESVDGVVDPEEVEIGSDLVRQGIVYAKEVRPRYTILQLLWDLGYLQDYAQAILGG